jgi:hypothetical protein
LEKRSAEWQSADDRNDRDRVNRARQAAEDLFKPTHQNTGAEPPIAAPNGVSSADQQPRRQPRIFAMPPPAAKSADVETPPEPKPMRRRTVIRRGSDAVPPSQVGRVRALTSYGMTPAQVAELYGVTVGEIERIISRAAYSDRSR